MKKNFKVYSSMKEISQKQWNYLSRDLDIYFSYEWMQHLEHMYPKELRIFILYNEDNKIESFACGFKSSKNLPFYYQPKKVLTSKQFLRLNDKEMNRTISENIEKNLTVNNKDVDESLKILENDFQRFLYPTLIFRNSYTSNIIVDSNLPDDEKKEVKKRMLKNIESYAKKNSYKSISFLYYPSEEKNILIENGYYTASIIGNLEIDTSQFKNFNDYINSLSKKRKNTIKKEMKIFNQYGFKCYEIDIFKNVNKIAYLELNNLNKHGDMRSIEALSKGKISFKKIFGKDLKVFGYYLNNELVASLISVHKGNAYTLLSVGLDYEKVGKSFTYFNIVFYESINYAIQHGINKIYLGPESYEVKMRRGADLLKMQSCVKPLCSSNNEYISNIIKYINLANEDVLNTYIEKYSKNKKR